MSRLRVAVIGARRARQGLGPFIARDLVAAGAEVVGLLATNAQHAAEAGEQCERFAGVRPPAFGDLTRLLADTRPQALAICAPHATHAALLDVALTHGLHALCEKPLVWGDRFAARSAQRVARFQERELVLFENCQWPYILPAFAELHPGSLGAAPQQFAMALEPAARGRDMLADSLPHPLSLLQALAPAAAPRAERVQIEPRAAHAVDVRFEYVVPAARVGVHIDLQPGDRHPRRFAVEIDGCAAERQVEPNDYTLRLACGERSVPLPDPMAALIADFVACATAARDPRAAERLAAIRARAELLETLANAWPAAQAASDA